MDELQTKTQLGFLCFHAIPEQQERVRLLESTACYHTPRQFYLPPKMPAPKRDKTMKSTFSQLCTHAFLQSYRMQVCKSNLAILSLQHQTLLMKVQGCKKICYCSKRQCYHGRTQSKAGQGSKSWDFSLQSGPTFLHISGFVISSSASLPHTSYSAFITLALLHVACIAHWQVVHVVPRYLIFIEHTCSSVCGQLTQFATNKSFSNQFKLLIRPLAWAAKSLPANYGHKQQLFSPGKLILQRGPSPATPRAEPTYCSFPATCAA